MESLQAGGSNTEAAAAPVVISSVKRARKRADPAESSSATAARNSSRHSLQINRTARAHGGADGSGSATSAMPVVGELATVKQKQNEMLATKWLQAADLKKLAETEGLEYKTGPFSSLEVEDMKAAVERYKTMHGLSQDDLIKLVATKGVGQRGAQKDLFKAVAMSLPGRPLFRVYQRMQRDYHPQRGKGLWTQDEDEALERSFAEHGPNWEKASIATERPASDCKDRYRNHLVNKTADLGKWSREEEESLFINIEAVAAAQNTDYLSPQSEIFWTAVAARMGSRKPQQCRYKWLNYLLPKMLADERSDITRRHKVWEWSEDRVLLQKVRRLPVRDPSEIQFGKLLSDDWLPCGPMQLQRRFGIMWASLSEDEKKLPWTAAIDRLLQSMEERNQPKPKTPKPPPSRTRKVKRPTPVPAQTAKSREIVADESDVEDLTASQGTVIPETQLTATQSSPSRHPSKKRRHSDETAEQRSARKAAKKARRASRHAEEAQAGDQASPPPAEPSGRLEADGPSPEEATNEASKSSQADQSIENSSVEAKAARKAAKKARRASHRA